MYFAHVFSIINLNMKVVNIKTNEFILTNFVYISIDEDITEYIKINDKYVYLTKKVNDIEKGYIGMNTLQMKNCGIKAEKDINVQPFNIKDTTYLDKSLNVTIHLLKQKESVIINNNELNKYFKEKYGNHIITFGQNIIMNFNENIIVLHIDNPHYDDYIILECNKYYIVNNVEFKFISNSVIKIV